MQVKTVESTKGDITMYEKIRDFVMAIDSSAANVFEVLDKIFGWMK